MTKTKTAVIIEKVSKRTSQGQGGRGRSISVSTSGMNKDEKRSHKSYRGQGK